MSKEITRSKLQWLDQVAADQAVSATTFRVAYVLMSRYLDAKTGDAYPSQSTLAEACGLKERATRNALTALAETGYLEHKKGGWGFQNRYRMTFPDRHGYAGQGAVLTGTDMPVNSDTDRHIYAGQGDTDRHEHAGQEISNPAHPCRPDRHIRASKPPLENPLYKEIGESPPLPPVPDRDAPDRFEEFWSVYPRHVAKGAAKKVFAKIVRRGEVSAETLIEGARRYAIEREGQEERFTKHPKTWLNGECWNDEPAPPPPANANRAAPAAYSGGGGGGQRFNNLDYVMAKFGGGS